MKILVVDNFDSFTYNLVQYFGELGAEMEVYRNDQISLDEIREKAPERICVSPGPCTPNEAGISCDVIREFGETIPLLGVCLGHQCIGQVFGGDVIRAERLWRSYAALERRFGAGRGVIPETPDGYRIEFIEAGSRTAA